MSRVPRALARAAVLWAAAMSGCAPDGATPSVATRDSAGVALVVASGPSWTLASAWTVEPVPLLDLGRTGAGPMHEFYRVSGAAFTEDGGIAVANRGSAQIRVYDAGGRFTAALGVEGDGPGEFRRLSGIVRYAGDSLAAFDPSSRRATVLSTSGALGRVLTFDIPGNAVTQELDLFSVSESAGFFVSVTVMPSGRPPGGLALFPQLVLELSPTGALLDTVTVMRGFEQYLGPTAIGTPPFARFSHAAVHRGELCVCDGVRPEYTVFARDGTKKRIVRMPGLSLDVP
ncbi:MAG: hypothetical protein FIA95_04450, partial [Gemmatimonadetes bacterium]|nr:hypothetical protein [Gemmatimonadota bacterium]